MSRPSAASRFASELTAMVAEGLRVLMLVLNSMGISPRVWRARRPGWARARAVEYGAGRPTEEAEAGVAARRAGEHLPAMTNAPIRIYFDFVDPLSYIASYLYSQADTEVALGLVWVGFELAPPPTPLTGGDAPVWVRRRVAALPKADELGLRLDLPALIPWSRKAHELHLYADDRGLAGRVRNAVFEAFFGGRRDIGRVDVLVEIAMSVGLDGTEAKAVLDVDRYRADLLRTRREATEAGVVDVPCHSVAGRLVEGFPDPAEVGTLLPDE